MKGYCVSGRSDDERRHSERGRKEEAVRTESPLPNKEVNFLLSGTLRRVNFNGVKFFETVSTLIFGVSSQRRRGSDEGRDLIPQVEEVLNLPGRGLRPSSVEETSLSGVITNVHISTQVERQGGLEKEGITI